jgi:hypothetical protein
LSCLTPGSRREQQEALGNSREQQRNRRDQQGGGGDAILAVSILVVSILVVSILLVWRRPLARGSERERERDGEPSLDSFIPVVVTLKHILLTSAVLCLVCIALLPPCDLRKAYSARLEHLPGGSVEGIEAQSEVAVGDGTSLNTSASNEPMLYRSPEHCTRLQLHPLRLQMSVHPTSRVLPPRSGCARRRCAAGPSLGLQALFSFKNKCNPLTAGGEFLLFEAPVQTRKATAI